MTFTPTPEQAAIVEAVRSTKDSIIINALAGAAKTSTLVLIAQALPVQPIFSCAFNKKIADEMGRRLPGHVESRTMNSIGHRVWGQATGKRLNVQTDKMYNIMKQLLDKLPESQRKDYNEVFGQILRAMRLAKSAGYVPRDARTMGQSLVSDPEDLLTILYQQIDIEITDDFLLFIDKALMLSIAEAYQGTIDFDDQLYMPTLFGGRFPQYPVVLTDETQDLSPLNHLMVEKLVAPNGRLIAVGDPWQSIYAFRGAHRSSMGLMKTRFDMKEMNLSVTFRCPRSIVNKVRSRVPHMQYPDWAIEGKVETLSSWSAEVIPEYSAIICRNNAPLFACAMRLIRAGRGVTIVGNDIGKGLITLMKKIAPKDIPQEDFRAKIGEWEAAEKRKAHKARRASIEDRAECLLVFAEAGKTSSESIAYAEHLFNSSGPIQLMTGHKSKGLEFDTVFHLNPHLVPSKSARIAAENGDEGQLDQELNLRYVIETRAKKELFLVDLEDMV